MPYTSVAPVLWQPGPTPKPVRGLFSVADVQTSPSAHTVLGVEYITNVCTQGKQWAHYCTPQTAKTVTNVSVVKGVNFVAYDALKCPMGVTQDEQEQLLRDAFDAKAEAVAEAVLQGELTGAAATTPIAALAAAELALATNYAGMGLIHMDRSTAVVTGAAGGFQDALSDTEPLRTVNGTPVVFGRGYAKGADGWIAASGRVIVLRGPLLTYSAPPAATVDAMVLAEQAITLLIECDT